MNTPKVRGFRLTKKEARLRAVEAHPERFQVRAATRHAIERGILKRPGRCDRCGKRCKPDSHHRLGYHLNDALVIDWLCTSCHATEDWWLKKSQPRDGDPCQHCGNTFCVCDAVLPDEPDPEEPLFI